MEIQGQRFVFSRFQDDALKKQIESLGGKVTMSVSSVTNILVVPQGLAPTTKEAEMVKANNIRVLDLANLVAFLKNASKSKSKYQGEIWMDNVTLGKVSNRFEQDAKTRLKSKSPLKMKSPPKPNDEPLPPLVDLPKFSIEPTKRIHSSSKRDEIYTINKFVQDLKNDKFVEKAIECETACLKNKLVVYKKLNNIDWSAEFLEKAKGSHYNTNLNEELEKMYDQIKNKLKSPKPSIAAKRAQLLDIIYNADVGLNTIKGQARNEVRSQVIKFIYMFFRAPTFFSSTFTNFMLTGPAGSGKTKIAMNIAHVMSNIGLMVTNNVLSVTRQSLVGQVIGESAPKTRFILAKALEGVFFIDEAYTLTPCPGKGSNSTFEREAMGELINLMDKFIGCMVVIVAGYKKEMRECFLPFNEGLARRFPRVFDLTAYTSLDMWHLFSTFLEPHVLKGMSQKQKTVIASYINAFNAFSKVDVFSNQAGDMLNLAHLVTEDYLLSESGYTSDEIKHTFVTFCRRKHLSLEFDNDYE